MSREFVMSADGEPAIEPAAAEVRIWARAQGIDVRSQGRVPTAVMRLYEEYVEARRAQGRSAEADRKPTETYRTG